MERQVDSEVAVFVGLQGIMSITHLAFGVLHTVVEDEFLVGQQLGFLGFTFAVVDCVTGVTAYRHFVLEVLGGDLRRLQVLTAGCDQGNNCHC